MIKEDSFALNQDGIFVPSSFLNISESIMQGSQPYLGKCYKITIIGGRFYLQRFSRICMCACVYIYVFERTFFLS